MSEPIATLYNYRFGVTHQLSDDEKGKILEVLQEIAYGTSAIAPKGAVFWGRDGADTFVNNFAPIYTNPEDSA